MDLLRTAWLPTDRGTLTPVAALREARTVLWRRGDWDMATLCLLHACLQTAVVLRPERCPDRDRWEALLESPPADLDEWLELNLGDHPWECTSAEGLVPIATLIPESPGENTIKKASDIGRWQQEVPKALTVAEASIALISDNIWGTRIGAGYRQGCRGEQPLTTLLEPTLPGAPLWARVWLNVLPADRWRERYGAGPCAFAWPWARPLPGTALTPLNTHPLEILWQMPRRWRLVIDDDGLIRQAHRQNGGRNYDGWERLHPLTPYFQKADGSWVAAKVGPHTGFDDWAAIALNQRAKTEPAVVVSEFIANVWRDEPLRLRCCGWALGDAGATGSWIDHVVPFYRKDAVQVDAIEAALSVAEKQRQRLGAVLKNARRGLQVQAGGLYPRLEAEFYRRLGMDDWDGWEAAVRKAARSLFWDVAGDHGIDLFIAAKVAKSL